MRIIWTLFKSGSDRLPESVSPSLPQCERLMNHPGSGRRRGQQEDRRCREPWRCTQL